MVSDSLQLPEASSLYLATQRLNRCTASFTVFCVDEDGRVRGVLSRGDILRFIEEQGPEGAGTLGSAVAKDAMTPYVRNGSGGRRMLYVREKGKRSWYEQISALRDLYQDRWSRIKLLPVLNKSDRLVDVLDLESPRTRARLETLVMSRAFPLQAKGADITNAGVADRRRDFDSIHYTTHWAKVRGLCDILVNEHDRPSQAVADVFDRARADEIVDALQRYEEWLSGHVSVPGLTRKDEKELLTAITRARTALVARYTDAARSPKPYFPLEADPAACESPQVIVVLGCRDDNRLKERVAAALYVVDHAPAGTAAPTIVLSGGGDGHEMSEAQRMLDGVREIAGADALTPMHDKPGWWSLSTSQATIGIVLEEDSLDTLGNAVFTWLTLKLEGERFGLRAESSPRLKTLLVVTDSLHAPRSHDLFRRVFAFRSRTGVDDGPRIAVRTAPAALDDQGSALKHLVGEAKSNAEIFRLVNPLTNGYDVIGNGHVRSILGQMLRLHEKYLNRWDLVRKYRRCLVDEPRT